MSVATLTISSTTIDGYPLSFSFDTFPCENGYPSGEAEHVEEELTTPGVDGKRWRRIYDQIPQLVVTGAWVSSSTHVLACKTADQMKTAVGREGLLIPLSGGTRFARLLVHVARVRAVVSPGIIIGPGITTGAAAVVSDWIFDVVKEV